MDKRSTEEYKDKMSEQKKEHYKTSDNSVLKPSNDTKSLDAGGCAQFGVHHTIFGGKYDEHMRFLDEETPHYVMDGNEKVQEEFVLLESKKKNKSSVTIFAAAAFGLEGPQQKNKKEKKTESAEVRAKLYLTSGSVFAKKFCFTGHPSNPEPPRGRAADPKSSTYIEPEQEEHWTRQQFMYFLKGFNERNYPGFFADGRTLRGHLDKMNIRTKGALLAMKNSKGECIGKLLAQAYLHELNCQNLRDHGEDDEYYLDEDEFEALPEDEALDLGGPEVVTWKWGNPGKALPRQEVSTPAYLVYNLKTDKRTKKDLIMRYSQSSDIKRSTKEGGVGSTRTERPNKNLPKVWKNCVYIEAVSQDVYNSKADVAGCGTFDNPSEGFNRLVNSGQLYRRGVSNKRTGAGGIGASDMLDEALRIMGTTEYKQMEDQAEAKLFALEEAGFEFKKNDFSDGISDYLAETKRKPADWKDQYGGNLAARRCSLNDRIRGHAK